MPEFGLLPSAKPHPFAGQNIAALEDILKTIGQAETLRRQRLLQSDVLKAISQGGDPQQMMSNIANVMTSQQPDYSSGFAGLTQKIGSLFAAPTTGLEDVITGEMIKSMIMSPVEQARLEYYKRPPKKKEPKTFSVTERGKAAKSIKEITESVPKRDIAGIGKGQRRNVRFQKDLIDAYVDFMNSSGYSALSTTQQKQLDALWDAEMKIGVVPRKQKDSAGNTIKVGWNPHSPEVKEARKRLRQGSDYDYEAARKAGAKPDKTGHWPSEFKREGSPEQFVDGLDTKRASLEDVITTYTKLARQELGVGATPEQIAKKAKELAKSKGWKFE